MGERLEVSQDHYSGLSLVLPVLSLHASCTHLGSAWAPNPCPPDVPHALFLAALPAGLPICQQGRACSTDCSREQDVTAIWPTLRMRRGWDNTRE
ncbi:Fibrocystin [Manis pentadactyla]|nr:Fibrocystin [Manis pentadactyla]